jgi:hypothetical protein
LAQARNGSPSFVIGGNLVMRYPWILSSKSGSVKTRTIWLERTVTFSTVRTGCRKLGAAERKQSTLDFSIRQHLFDWNFMVVHRRDKNGKQLQHLNITNQRGPLHHFKSDTPRKPAFLRQIAKVATWSSKLRYLNFPRPSTPFPQRLANVPGTFHLLPRFLVTSGRIVISGFVGLSAVRSVGGEG